MTTINNKSARLPNQSKSKRPKIVPGLYTFVDAAKRLGIGLAQAYRLDNDGRFPVPVVYIGAVRRVRVAELEHYLQGSAPSPAPGCPMSDEEIAEGLAAVDAA
jgi:predicted DNA-binding transcriptional regulator AlpA